MAPGSASRRADGEDRARGAAGQRAARGHGGAPRSSTGRGARAAGPSERSARPGRRCSRRGRRGGRPRPCPRHERAGRAGRSPCHGGGDRNVERGPRDRAPRRVAHSRAPRCRVRHAHGCVRERRGAGVSARVGATAPGADTFALVSRAAHDQRRGGRGEERSRGESAAPGAVDAAGTADHNPPLRSIHGRRTGPP